MLCIAYSQLEVMVVMFSFRINSHWS